MTQSRISPGSPPVDGSELLIQQQQQQEQEPAGQIRPESVIGDDHRKQVTPGVSFPFRAICRLRIHFGNSRPRIGTGFIILKNVMLTAGHNLFKGQYARAIEIYAGINGDFNSNFGQDVVFTNRLRVPDEFKARNPDFDFGIAILNKNLGSGSAGVVRIQPLNSLQNRTALISGYPNKIPEGVIGVPNNGSTQWYASGRLAETDRQLFYFADTSGGQSGSPVMVRINEPGQPPWSAVGIHAHGEDNREPFGNSATRITTEMLLRIRDWLPASTVTA